MANLDQSWVGVDVTEVFSEACGRPVAVVNDADAAGLAEVQFGAAKGQDGLVIATTLGTGIGTALIYNGVLIPNTELGHIILSRQASGRRRSTPASAIREKARRGLQEVGQAPDQVLLGLMEIYFNPAPVHRRRRRERVERKVPAVRGYQDPDRARQAA